MSVFRLHYATYSKGHLLLTITIEMSSMQAQLTFRSKQTLTVLIYIPYTINNYTVLLYRQYLLSASAHIIICNYFLIYKFTHALHNSFTKQ